MTQALGGGQQSAFSRWLRTGRLPVVRASKNVELKFNPWHDPTNGQFTFVGSGQYHGREAGEGDRGPRRVGLDRPRTRGLATAASAKKPTAAAPKRPEDRRAVAVPSKPAAAPQSSAAGEFAVGVGEGVYGAAREAAAAVHSALTTNPLVTARDVGRGIASTIDAVVAAEDVPVVVQASRMMRAAANAPARQIGRATGSVAGNAALAITPGVALGKVAAMRRLRGAVPRPTYDPPQIGWVKENLSSEKAWKAYNDGATGARPGQAPALMRTMLDGSKRPVKFDGVEGDYVIDRKWSIRDAARARAQLLRQSEVLAQHRLIGTWEVPNEKQRIAAHKLLKKMNVTNIRVRIVKP